MRIIYGINPVKEALKARPQAIEGIKVAADWKGGEIEKITSEAQRLGVKIELLSKALLNRLAGTTKHQGIIAELKPYRYVNLEAILKAWRVSKEKALILILDSIQDPQNLGSLIRTAYCAGVHGAIIPKDRSASITPSVVKASAGATEYALISRVTNLNQTIERLKTQGIWVVGTASEAEKTIYDCDLDIDMAVVIGSEGKGIRPLIKRACDFIVSIPMKGRVLSLNASVAGGIVLYECLRRRIQR